MSNRKWLLGLTVLVLIFGFVLARFFASTTKVDDLVRRMGPDKSEQAAAVKHVVLIAQELDNPFWREMEQGASDAAGKLGMQIDYMGPIRINPEEQRRLLEKAIAAKPDAILAQGMGDLDYGLLMNKAVEQGIPVLAVDADEPDSRRLAYVGTDNLEAGKQMGELVLEENSGSIGVIIGSEMADNQRLRLEGFRSAISNKPGLKIADVRSSNISRIGAAKQTEAMLKQHGDIRVIVGFSALDAAGILEGIQAAGKEGIRVYGFDDMEATRKGIGEGTIRASIVQQPAEIGAASVRLLDQVFRGKKISGQHFVPANILDRKQLQTGGSGR
ncbi:substrate-binding domain-containing protein [Paenibacillus sp. SAF-054]|uniref:substrate-binding domain-containing protein n=1 Tax=unclassified Paenibacillus TaxID=185978 RepID=UPI003F7F76CF